jgi:molecular chaperone DnaK
MILATEKMIKEGEGKISDTAKSELEDAIKEAKEKLASENLDELKAATERLQNVSHKIATEMYQQAGGQPGAEAGPQPGAEAGPQPGAEQPKQDDDVVDADYKEV